MNMKQYMRNLLVAAVVGASLWTPRAAPALEDNGGYVISEVVARQRWPWERKVDIDFQLTKPAWASSDQVVRIGVVASNDTREVAVSYAALAGTAALPGVSRRIVCLSASEIYVTPSGAGVKDGSSWENAFDNLQAAVDAADSGDIIYLKEGVFTNGIFASGESHCSIADKSNLDFISGNYSFPADITGYTWTAGSAPAEAGGTLLVTGTPLEVGAITPIYGSAFISQGTSVECSAPSTVNLAGTNYICNGYTLISYDFDTALPTTNSATSTSFTYTHSGYAKLTWHWQANGDASMNVAVSSSDNALGSVSGTMGDLAYGDAVTLTATPAEGCRFSHWSGLPAGVDPRSATISFTVGDVDLDIVAHFINTPNTIIYVKAAATGEANGSSWADAYPTITKAVSAAANGDTIYVAQGVYIEKLSLTKSLKIYGGFPGLSMDETLADRNPESYQTIVTPSTAAQTSAVWQHVEPNVDSYSLTTANTTTPLIGSDGTVKLPSFTGDYDSWVSSASVSATMIYANGVCTNRVDGLWLVNGTQWIQNGNGAVTTVANCNFIGGGTGGSIAGYDSSNAIGKYLCMTNCLFFGAKMKVGRGGFLLTKGGDYLFDDCRIVGFVNDGYDVNYGGSIVYYWAGTMNFVWRNCIFARAITYNASTYAHNYNNALFAVEGGTFNCLYENFSFTNNVIMSVGGTWCYPVFCSSTGQFFENLNFSRNIFAIKPTYTSTINHYMMFARQALNVNNSTFADNTIYVPQAASSEGPFYAGIMTMNASAYRPIVNCIFKNNSIKMKDSIGMTPTFGQILVADANAQLGIANCVFTHTDVDTFDIAFPTATAQTHTIVNSLFERNGGEDKYQPFLLDSGAKLNLVNSSVAGMNADDFRTQGTINFVSSDAMPFALVEDEVEGYANQVLRPSALSPSMRDSRPVALDSLNITKVFGQSYTNGGVSFSYKSADEKWTALLPKHAATKSGQLGLITDAVDAMRTETSFTRGAVQDSVVGAENAPTLTILKEPWAGGTIAPALSIAADAETGVTPAVTAKPSYDGTAVTWYELDGSTVLAQGNTLPPQSLTSSKTVIASFDSPEVTITFDLDGAGTFANGTDKYSLTVSSGEVLEVPSFTLDQALMEEWLPYAPPMSVPATNAVFTLKWVSTEPRIFRVRPGGTGDGSSWQNAAGDLDAVIADAGRYRGEVWFQKGTYALEKPLHIMATVGLYGGFNGTETSHAEADGTPSETVLSGELESSVLSSAFTTDNIGTNFTVQGFTFTSFKNVITQSTQQHGMLFKDCVFTKTTDTACNVYSRTTFDSCLFTGVSRAAYFNSDTSEGTVFTNCVFRDNTTPTDSWLIGFGSTGSPNAYFRYCDFTNNTVPGSGSLISNQHKLTITDCNFSGNSAYYLIWQDRGGSMMRMYRTKITDNKFNYGFRNRDGAFNVFRDCYIADNNNGGGMRGTIFTFVSNSSAWQHIQNTVMRNNTTSAALIETRLHQIVNCMILDTIFTGTDKSDIKSIHSNDKGINILNTVFRNSTEGYVAVKNGLTTTLMARYASVVMSGELDPAITIDWSSDLVTNVYAKVRRPVLTKGNVASMQLSGSSPYARMGKLPYIDGSFNVFFYDTTASVWRKLTASGTSSKSGTAAKDAFGDPWSEDGVSPGPLNFMPISPTLLIIR